MGMIDEYGYFGPIWDLIGPLTGYLGLLSNLGKVSRDQKFNLEHQERIRKFSRSTLQVATILMTEETRSGFPILI